MSSKEIIITEKCTEEKVIFILSLSSKILDRANRIGFISDQFLGIPYKRSTLIGGIDEQEVFVINLREMDCFTFIEYVEAMSLSISFNDFKENLKRVRYKNGEIKFERRNHFFTDWIENNSDFIEDVTENIGDKYSKNILKTLNLKEDKNFFIEGINPKNRNIKYIPSLFVPLIKEKLKTGDYIGIYSETIGLDVSHVGIIIKKRGSTYIRHASSVKGSVIDEDLEDYLQNKAGIIILRPR